MLIIKFLSPLIMNLKTENSNNLKFLLILFSLFFVIFVFTSDGHRFTFDEDVAAQQSKRIATLSPDPSYVDGESRVFFEYPWLFPPEHNQRPICENAILCSHGTIIHSVTQAPFIFINNNLNIITTSEIWTTDDFDDLHYVAWRNNIDPDFTFMELFYAPFFSALSACVLFLISTTYGFSVRTSLILVFLFCLSTVTWAYSQTSLNSVPLIFFILTGFFFYRKFQKTNSYFNLILTAIFFGIGFLTRQDMILLIIPFFVFILIASLWKNSKLKTFFKTLVSFSIPAVSSYVIYRIIQHVRIGDTGNPPVAVTAASDIALGAVIHPVHQHIFGMLFSPGAGLFFYAPILFTCFVGFFDFYKKHRSDCILMISLVVCFILFNSTNYHWHGFNSWGARYLLPILPFLILPLGASIEKRTNFFFKLSIIFLGALGFLINLIYLLQDVAWFVWGFFGSDERGLYSLARKADDTVHDMWINPLIIWTFEYSQIVQATLWLFSKPQLDIFLAKIFGIELFVICLTVTVFILFYMLVKSSRNYIVQQKEL